MSTPPKPTVSPTLTRDSTALIGLFYAMRTRQDVADLLEIPDGHLVYIMYLRKDYRHYRTFKVNKRTGGTRTISAPPGPLAILQRKLNHVLQLVYSPPRGAHGFVVGRSVVTNAAQHAGKRWLLNIDLEDFFPSINFGRVRGMFMARPYQLSPQVATVLSQLCCARNELPQGAPTSPVVSNMVCGRLDGALLALSRRFRCQYTRYCDDISFSTSVRSFPSGLAQEDLAGGVREIVVGPELEEIVDDNGFVINHKKTRLVDRNNRQSVTGLTVNKFPNVPRAKIRELRGMMHAWEKFGLGRAEREFRRRFDARCRRPGGKAPRFRNVVRGKLEFVRMVRGSTDSIYLKLRDRLHKLDPTIIAEAPEQPAIVTVGSQTAPDQIWQIYHDEYKDLVIQLQIRKPNGDIKSGTAWAFRSRQLATAAHNFAGEVSVELSGATVTLADRRDHPRSPDGVDCTLAQTPQSIVPHRKYLPRAARLPGPGEPVAVIGYPTVPQRQPALAVIPGHVEVVSTDYRRAVDFFQLNILAAGGLSGAPVVNRGGVVVGLIVESTFEQVGDGVPGREFCQALPVKYLDEIP